MRECSINIKTPHLSAVQCGCVETCFLYRDVKLWHRMQRSLFKSVMWWRLICGHVVLMAEHLLSNMLPCNADKVVTWGMPDVLVPRLQCYSLLHLFLCVGSWIHWSCQEDTVECKQGNLYVREACRTVWMLFCVSPGGTCRICSRGLMCLHSFRAYTGPCLRQSNSGVSTSVTMGSALNGPRCVSWVQIPWQKKTNSKNLKVKGAASLWIRRCWIQSSVQLFKC